MNIFNQNLKSPLEVKVEWVRNSSVPPLTLSISALMLNKDNVINKLEDFIFYGTPNNGNDIISSDKSVTCDALNFEKGFGTESSYKMNLELGKVSDSIDRINIVVSINTKEDGSQLPAFDSLTKAVFSIRDAAGLTFTAELNKTGESSCRCITVGLVRRYALFWRFEEEMELKLGGLELIYNEYMSDSIVKSKPFSVIGDLNVIENIYKEKEKKTEIFPDGSKKIFEKSKEFIITTIGQIKGSTESAPQVVGMPKIKKSSTTNTTNKKEKGIMPRTKQKESKVAIKSEDEVVVNQAPPKQIHQDGLSINNSGHGVMPKTSGKKSKTYKATQQNVELKASENNQLTNATKVKSNKATSMANRFANRKNKRT